MTDWDDVTVTLEDVDIDKGWWAFAYVAYYVAQFGIDPGQLAYRWHREVLGGISANFEVLKTP